MRHILLLLALAQTASAQSIPGLWGTEQHFGPRVRGELVIDGRSDPWREWVRASTTPQAMFANRLIETDADHRYGYGWHVHDFTVNGRTFREYGAEGNGGQLVMVIPDLDLVVGVNAGSYGSLDWYRWMMRAVPDVIIPAAR